MYDGVTETVWQIAQEAGALPYGAFQAIQRAMLQSDRRLMVGQVPVLRLVESEPPASASFAVAADTQNAAILLASVFCRTGRTQN